MDNASSSSSSPPSNEGDGIVVERILFVVVTCNVAGRFRRLPPRVLIGSEGKTEDESDRVNRESGEISQQTCCEIKAFVQTHALLPHPNYQLKENRLKEKNDNLQTNRHRSYYDHWFHCDDYFQYRKEHRFPRKNEDQRIISLRYYLPRVEKQQYVQYDCLSPSCWIDYLKKEKNRIRLVI